MIFEAITWLLGPPDGAESAVKPKLRVSSLPDVISVACVKVEEDGRGKTGRE
jgi:hypothetical protein